MYHILVRPSTVGEYDDPFLWRRNFLEKVKCFSIEVKPIEAKSNTRFGPLFGVAFFLENDLKKNKEKQKTKQR